MRWGDRGMIVGVRVREALEEERRVRFKKEDNFFVCFFDYGHCRTTTTTVTTTEDRHSANETYRRTKTTSHSTKQANATSRLTSKVNTSKEAHKRTNEQILL